MTLRHSTTTSEVSCREAVAQTSVTRNSCSTPGAAGRPSVRIQSVFDPGVVSSHIGPCHKESPTPRRKSPDPTLEASYLMIYLRRRFT
jgi:hypothetical protein